MLPSIVPVTVPSPWPKPRPSPTSPGGGYGICQLPWLYLIEILHNGSTRIAEVPAGWFGKVVWLELLHPEHARKAENLRRDDAEDRVRRRAACGSVRAVHLVALDLEWPAARDE